MQEMKFECNREVLRNETAEVSRESIAMGFLFHAKEFELGQGLAIITYLCV